jgi:hypothetical protein
VPDYTTIRTWMVRLGIDALEEPLERADDWIWMLDHSNQIGHEKVLCVLGIRASKWPPPGTALRHEDMRALALRPDERLPISTEILESRFGLYKQLEGQHAQGGFTSLLLALGVLGSPHTPEKVTAAFGRTKTRAIKTWVKQHLGETLTARRRSTYAESQSATKQLTAT